VVTSGTKKAPPCGRASRCHSLEILGSNELFVKSIKVDDWRGVRPDI